VVVELLAVGLSNGTQIPPSDRAGCFFVLAMSPSAFVQGSEFDAYVESLAERLTSIPPAKGFSRVMLPGEPEALTREDRQKNGTPVAERTWEQINEVAQDLGVPVD
jgi:LDH2 family malate/lactate/ureidoglycolate dehydrogenase